MPPEIDQCMEGDVGVLGLPFVDGSLLPAHGDVVEAPPVIKDENGPGQEPGGEEPEDGDR